MAHVRSERAEVPARSHRFAKPSRVWIIYRWQRLKFHFPLKTAVTKVSKNLFTASQDCFSLISYPLNSLCPAQEVSLAVLLQGHQKQRSSFRDL